MNESPTSYRIVLPKGKPHTVVAQVGKLAETVIYRKVVVNGIKIQPANDLDSEKHEAILRDSATVSDDNISDTDSKDSFASSNGGQDFKCIDFAKCGIKDKFLIDTILTQSNGSKQEIENLHYIPLKYKIKNETEVCVTNTVTVSGTKSGCSRVMRSDSKKANRATEHTLEENLLVECSPDIFIGDETPMADEDETSPGYSFSDLRTMHNSKYNQVTNEERAWRSYEMQLQHRKELRITRKRETRKRKQARETQEEYENRKRRAAERQRLKRSMETEEQKADRRRKQAEYKRMVRYANSFCKSALLSCESVTI